MGGAGVSGSVTPPEPPAADLLPGEFAVDANPVAPLLTLPVAEASTALPAHLESFDDRARGYVKAASSANTRRAYVSDWKHFPAWCRRQNLSALLPDPQVVGLHITACASGSAVGTPARGSKPNSVSTIERRLAAIGWNCAQRGMPLDRKDRAISTVMAGIRNTHPAPPRQKEAILPEDLSPCWKRSTGEPCAAFATGRCC